MYVTEGHRVNGREGDHQISYFTVSQMNSYHDGYVGLGGDEPVLGKPGQRFGYTKPASN